MSKSNPSYIKEKNMGIINAAASFITSPKVLLIYLLIVSVISIIICIYDKKISKKNNVKLRVPEKRLLFFSAIGGSIAMFVTMLIIRHKTKHAKFMVGIPVIMVLQAAAVFFLIKFGIIKL